MHRRQRRRPSPGASRSFDQRKRRAAERQAAANRTPVGSSTSGAAAARVRGQERGKLKKAAIGQKNPAPE